MALITSDCCSYRLPHEVGGIGRSLQRMARLKKDRHQRPASTGRAALYLERSRCQAGLHPRRLPDRCPDPALRCSCVLLLRPAGALCCCFHSAMPSYLCMLLIPRTTCAVACDGIWDEMSSEDAVQVSSWLTAAIPMANPCCSCKLTRVRVGAADRRAVAGHTRRHCQRRPALPRGTAVHRVPLSPRRITRSAALVESRALAPQCSKRTGNPRVRQETLQLAADRVRDTFEGEEGMTYEKMRRRRPGKHSAPEAGRSLLHDDLSAIIIDFRPLASDAARKVALRVRRRLSIACPLPFSLRLLAARPPCGVEGRGQPDQPQASGAARSDPRQLGPWPARDLLTARSPGRDFSRLFLTRSRCGHLTTTWTVLQHDDPNHLGLRCNALPEHQMALITSGCPSEGRTS